MNRPRCKRCKGPLDIWYGESDKASLICNNPEPLDTDEQFFKRWNNLPGDDIVRLQDQVDPLA